MAITSDLEESALRQGAFVKCIKKCRTIDSLITLEGFENLVSPLVMKAKNVVQLSAVDPRSAIYHLKVHILNISPMIFRRFIIDSNTHIAELHHLIQTIMGWENQHLPVLHIWGWIMELPMRAGCIIGMMPIKFISKV